MTSRRTIYEVRFQSRRKVDAKPPRVLTAVRTREEADGKADEMNRRAEATKLDARYFVEEMDVTGAFEMPPKPTPRERYEQLWKQTATGPGTWDVTDVTIIDHQVQDCDREVVATYRRDYPGRPPFEPFRQGGRDYALISRHYTGASVLDLSTGEVVAEGARGFCPVGFYVPDWWDVHDGSILPGSSYWEAWDEWPDGTLGFVWGCVWGDDNGWKVQALDLSGVADGVIRQDDRFGYLRLDDVSDDPRDFIRVHAGEGSRGPAVTFSAPRLYSVDGALLDDGTN